MPDRILHGEILPPPRVTQELNRYRVKPGQMGALWPHQLEMLRLLQTVPYPPPAPARSMTAMEVRMQKQEAFQQLTELMRARR